MPSVSFILLVKSFIVKGLNPGVIYKSVEYDRPGERSPENDCLW